MLPENRIKLRSATACAIALMLPACATLPKKEFVPVDPEMLVEWSVEGAIEISDNSGNDNAHFLFENIDGDLRLVIHPNAPVEPLEAVIKQSADIKQATHKSDDENAVTSNDPKASRFIRRLTNVVPLEQLNYWLRALPVTAQANIQSEDQQITSIKELNWEISYAGYMQVEQYALPDQMTLKGPNAEVQMSVVRAETGLLSNPCPGNPANYSIPTDSTGQNASVGVANSNVVAKLVPDDDSAPLPRWIDDTSFCRQLIKVHGNVPNPRIGLYGPGSMMWRLSGPLAPGGMGAGRALLLQTAHPWITAGIDEHSIVRYDPVERARRTAVNVSTMVFGSMPQVMRAAHKVHKTHQEIKGKIPYHAGAFHQGSEYRANEVNAMIWVHATLWDTLVMMYEELEEPLTQYEKDRFYEETKLFAMLFGIPESALPKNWNDFMAYNQAMWNSAQLTVTDNARVLKEDLFTPKSIWLTFPLWIQEMVTAAHLPPRIREGYGMEYNTWEKFNNAWLMASAKFANWILPDVLGTNAIKHEAEARLKGERVGGYHQMVIENLLGTERLVN